MKSEMISLGPFDPSKPPVPYLSIAQRITTKSVDVGEPLCGLPDRAATLACRSTSARRHGGPPLQKINVVRRGVVGKIPFSCFMSDLFVTMNFFHEIDLSFPNLVVRHPAEDHDRPNGMIFLPGH